MSKALINRSLTNVRTELEFLYESNVITKSLYDNLIQTLPEKYTGEPPVDSVSGVASASLTTTSTNDYPTPSNNPTPTPQYSEKDSSSATLNKEFAEAMYDFAPQQDSDLKLTRGDKVEVLEKLNSDWWKGRVGSNEGIFPSNYVRLLDQRSAAPPPPQNILYQQNSNSSYQQQQPFPPPSTNYYQQQQQPQQQQEQPVVVQQNSGNSHPHMRKFGRQLKDAAVFGAGATIGSDIVNSIF